MAFFPEVEKIRYEGPTATNPLSFRHYDEKQVVEGKTMKEHFRFAVAYWHTLRGMGGDPFGPGCAKRPWEDGTDSVEMAIKRVHVAFEFLEKLGAPYYCFHDRDVAPEGKNLKETNANLDRVVQALKEEQQRTGIKLLWGTANLFSNKRYMHGAATSPNADVFAYAAAQVKKCLEVTKELGGVNYVFWGGREGYSNLYNNDMMHELAYASGQGLLGSIDANRGDLLLGWDTDQFPTDLYLTTQCMLVILQQGGLAPGGVNFDAKVRRESFEPVDLFHAHIGGMDAFAHGLKIAARIRKDGVLKDFVRKRYSSWDTGVGKQVEAGQARFEDLGRYVLDKGQIAPN